MISRRSALGLLAAAAATALTACTSSPAAGTDTLDAAGFAGLVAKPGTVVVDVRTPAEFASGHLADAVNLDVNASDFAAQVARLDAARTYAVYCKSGNRSATALGIMKKAGIAQAYHLAGGIGAWTGAGRPVVR